MMDAFASIISNNQNVVMKFLAAMTIVLAIPNMVYSFSGRMFRFPCSIIRLCGCIYLPAQLYFPDCCVFLNKKDMF